MRVTVHDVAKRAGVSISTVSRVLNGSAPVSDDKARRVAEAADALRYTPNPAARSLLKRRTGTIAAVLPFISGEFFAELLCGLDGAAQTHAQMLLVSASHRHAAEYRTALQDLVFRSDGLIVMAPELEAGQVLAMTGKRSPVVFLNTRVEAGQAPAVNFDNYGGMRSITEHVVAAGNERIAFIKGPDKAHDARERLRGFRRGLAGRALGSEYDGDFSAQAGYEAATRILRTVPRPDAIVAANDLSAIGALRALLERGIRVPGDMALAGFDDTPSARYATPSLSTVHVPIRALARRAVDVLICCMDEADMPSDIHVEPLNVQIRESTCPRNTALGSHQGSLA